MNQELLIKSVLNEAFYVHSTLGPGLLENVYKNCLAYQLEKRGFFVEVEKPIPVVFDTIKMECGYRADIVVERDLIIETKCIEAIAPIHVAQLLTYLKFANLRFGLVLNFNSVLLKNGIKRVVNGY